jgi:hypothetical protein
MARTAKGFGEEEQREGVVFVVLADCSSLQHIQNVQMMRQENLTPWFRSGRLH